MSAALEVARFLCEGFLESQHAGERITWLVSRTEARQDPWLSPHSLGFTSNSLPHRKVTRQTT